MKGHNWNFTPISLSFGLSLFVFIFFSPKTAWLWKNSWGSPLGSTTVVTQTAALLSTGLLSNSFQNSPKQNTFQEDNICAQHRQNYQKNASPLAPGISFVKFTAANASKSSENICAQHAEKTKSTPVAIATLASFATCIAQIALCTLRYRCQLPPPPHPSEVSWPFWPNLVFLSDDSDVVHSLSRTPSSHVAPSAVRTHWCIRIF